MKSDPSVEEAEESEEEEWKPKVSGKKFDRRPDVLNKTLLRSLKKYLTAQFNEETHFEDIPGCEKSSRYVGLLRTFVQSNYAAKLQDVDFGREDAFEDIVNYVGIIINFSMIKKDIQDKDYLKFNTQYYDCLYKYSHRKLSSIFSDKILKFLFEDFIETGKIYEHMKQDDTMSKNPQAYEETIRVFKDSFMMKRYTPRF